MRLIAFAMAVGLVGCVPEPPKTAPIPEPREDGYIVRRFPEGAAWVRLSEDVFANYWSIDCHKDIMSDQRNCVIKSWSGGPRIFFEKQNIRSICVTGHDYPGRIALIRFGADQPVQTNVVGCTNSAKVINKITSDEVIYTRHVRWPYDRNVDKTIRLDGLAKAVSVAKELSQLP